MTQKNEYRTLLDEAERLLTDATNTAIGDRVELRDAVCAFFASEQRRGCSVESIRNSVESILLRAEVRVGQGDDHKQLARELVEWCVGRDGLTS